MPIGQKTPAMVGHVREIVLAHQRQTATVIAENDQRVTASTELILESHALLDRVGRLLDRHSTSGATSPAAL